jgi:hypothetical protein
MSRSLLIICVSLLLLATVSPAQRRASLRPRAIAIAANDAWFPLATGNYWIFEREAANGASSGHRMAVGAAVARNGAIYYQIDNPFGPNALVRNTEDGRLVALDPDTGAEALWYDFGAPDGVWWTAEGRPCLDGGRIAQRGLEADTPAGRFSDAMKIELRDPSCADAGSTDELFVAGLGLVEHEEITIAGPQRFRLREARVDGKLISSVVPAFRLGLALDKPVYTPNLMPPVEPDQAVPLLRAVLRIENTSSQPVQLEFPSGQQFEAQIVGPSGEVLYTWSSTRLFIQAATSMNLDNGFQEFAVETALGNADTSEPWAAGRYLLRAWLPTSSQPHYEAQLPFEITAPVH